MAAPEISVITVTYKRRDLLLQKLESLKAQTLEFERFELVLCVNGCEATLEALQNVELPFAFTLISFAENRGSALGRNACVAQARGKLLYFSDDDVLLLPETLAKHLEFHAAQATPVVAIAAVDWETENGLEQMRPAKVNYWNVHGINTSMPKLAFDAAGGFPDWLTGYGHEDVLLGYRLKQKGYAFVALPELTVRHIGANPMRGLQPEKAHSAGRNAVQIVQRYPELAFRLGVHPLAIFVKRLAFAFPIGYLWKTIHQGSYVYERAYLGGALEEKHHGN